MIVFSPPVFAQRKLSERKKADTPKTRVIVKESPKGLLSAKFKSDKYESERILHDLDKDGWCDLWCSLFKNEIAHRNKRIDTDGDGLTDYEEMVLMRNPSVKGAMPRRLTAAEIAQGKKNAVIARKKAEENMKALRADLAPFMVNANREAKTKEEFKALKLAKRQAKVAKDKAQRKAAIDAIKRKHGIDANHDKGTLVGESEAAGPIFMKPQDALSANTAFVDDLWPSGLYAWQNPAFSRNLTGAGVEVSVFEAFESSGAAGIRLGHTELTGRAAQPDGSSPSNHATAVASVIIGGGNLDVFQGGTNQGRLLRGMAYEGEVDGYDLEDFMNDTADSVLAGQSFSNHSYGVPGGWEIRNFGGVNRWFWPFNQFAEDPRLGTYSESMAGGVSSEDLDNFVYSVETQLPVFASGNPNNFGPNQPVIYVVEVNGIPQNSNIPRDWFNGDDGFDTVISPATAKNVLTVGSITDINFSNNTLNVSDFSGTGPTDDGRLKPEIVSVGQRNQTLGYLSSLFTAHNGGNTGYYNGLQAGADTRGNVNLQGTSFAAPTVTGGLMLGEERRKELLPSAAPLLASTWRAAAVHTALDLGAVGPDFTTGFGNFDAEALVTLIENDVTRGRGSLIKEFSVEQNSPKTFYVTLPANVEGHLTLAGTDPAGDPAAFASVVDDPTPMLVHNLDLSVEDMANNTTHLPWVLNADLAGESAALRSAPATRGVDSVNNLEKVTIDASASERRLAVTIAPPATLQGGTQKVSLIMTGVEPEDPKITGSEFTQNPTNLNEFAITIDSDPGAFFTLERSTDLTAGSWTAVSTFKAENSQATTMTNAVPSSTKEFWRVRRGE